MSFAKITYTLCALTISVILFLHIFKIADMNTDKFSSFLIILLFTLFLFPAVANIKAFGIIDLKRDPKVLSLDDKKNVEKHRQA